MSHDVFICYSSRDKPVADAVCAVLEAEGVRCWIAPRDILPGADWGESIIDAINDARAMVLIFSSNANAAQSQIKREVERAVNKGIPVIPFRIENVMPTKSLEYFLSTPHWLDAFTPPLDEHVRQLADSIKRLLGKQVVARPLLFAAPPPHAAAAASARSHQDRLQGYPGRRQADSGMGEGAEACRHAGGRGGCSDGRSMVCLPPHRDAGRPAGLECGGDGRQHSRPISFTCARSPSGYFCGQAQDRVDGVEDRSGPGLRQGQAANTPPAYASFMQTYAKQGVDMDEAQEAYANANAQEGEARNAYRQAIATRTPRRLSGFPVHLWQHQLCRRCAPAAGRLPQ